MLPALLIVYLAISSVMGVFGVLAGGFIVAVNLQEKAKGRSLNTCDHILLALGISGLSFQCLTTVEVPVGLFIMVVPGFNYLHLAINQLLTWAGNTLFWLTACLSVFYCVKIVDFNNRAFIWVKLRISKLVMRLLLASVLGSLVCSLPVYYHALYFNVPNILMDNLTFYFPFPPTNLTDFSPFPPPNVIGYGPFPPTNLTDFSPFPPPNIISYAPFPPTNVSDYLQFQPFQPTNLMGYAPFPQANMTGYFPFPPGNLTFFPLFPIRNQTIYYLLQPYDLHCLSMYLLANTVLGFFLPLLIGVASITLILISLYRHTRRMKENVSDFSKPRLEVHFGAARMVGSLLLVYIALFIGQCAKMFSPSPNVALVLTLTVTCSVPALCTILILGNTKLRQALCKVLLTWKKQRA